LTPNTKVRPFVRQERFLVNEIFYSVQGEGASIGLPAIFLRLQVCNLTCEWCDTRYTWDINHPDYDKYQAVDLEEIIPRLSEYPCRRLIITGGEPLLHAAAIEKLLERLGEEWTVEIETNGTLPGRASIRERCQLNISPKLPSAKNKAKTIRPAVLDLLKQSRNPWFKFVVAGLADFKEMVKVIDECGLPQDRIIVMPEGQDPATLAAHALEIVELVKEKGYRLLPRLHVMLYGNRRGV
jgi:7-carboxy-7-deazaguanine synthase